jgi:hypothetical protein
MVLPNNYVKLLRPDKRHKLKGESKAHYGWYNFSRLQLTG